MSFISSATTITLTAYLTNAGRNFLVDINGKKEDITITQFSLGDNDTNYNQASQTTSNLLTSGNVPGITGDDTDCVKSLSENIDDIKNKIFRLKE